MVVVLSGPSVGAASTTFGGSAADGNAVAAETDGVGEVLASAGADAVGLTAGAIARVGAAALADETSAEPAAADADAAGAAAGAFATDVDG